MSAKNIFDDFRAIEIARIRELHRTGKLEEEFKSSRKANDTLRELGLTDAGFINIGEPIDVKKCIEDPNYK